MAPDGKTTTYPGDFLKKIAVPGADNKKASAYQFSYKPEQRGDYIFWMQLPPVWMEEEEQYFQDNVKVVLHVQAQKGWENVANKGWEVQPLTRHLAGLDAWITGLRRSQSATRADVAKIESDAAHGGILKINPLADWSESQVWDHIKKNGVPYNRLHDQGYPSIGCAPCTRAVKPGEDVRAGRWWWESADHKECGLHPPERSKQ